MHARRTFLLFAASSFGAAARAVAGELLKVHHGRTRPGCETGIPNLDYQYRTRSGSQTIISHTGLLLRNVALEAAAAPLPATPFSTPETLPPGRLELPPPVNIPGTPPLVRGGAEGGASRSFPQQARPSVPPPAASGPSTIQVYQLDRDSLTVDHCAISQVALQLHSNGVWVLSLRADQNRRPQEPEQATFNPRLHLRRNEFTVRMRCLGAAVNPPPAFAAVAGKPVLAVLAPQPFWVENGQPYYLRYPCRDDDVESFYALIDRVEIEFFYR